MKKIVNGIEIQLTEQEISDLQNQEQAWLKKKAEYDAEEWKRNRQAEYPTLQDCIHAILDGSDTLTELQAKRTATKTKYPKSGA